MLVVNSFFAITTPSFLPNAKLYSLKKKLKPQMEMQHLLFNQPFYVYSHTFFCFCGIKWVIVYRPSFCTEGTVYLSALLFGKCQAEP